MFNDFIQKIPRSALLIGSAIMFGPILLLIILGASLLKPEPINPAAVLGCYISPNAPALDVQTDKIRIVDGSNRAFSYVVDINKQGYHLAVRPSLALVPKSSGGFGFKQMRGIGYFWPLLNNQPGDTEHLFSMEDFGGRFSMFARNGDRYSEMIYTRVEDENHCRNSP